MSDEIIQLTSFSLTHVHYDPADPISYLCAWLALVPQAICVMYVTLIWSTREIEIVLLGAGQFVCEVLNFALKRLIKEERPPRMNGNGYGMPSSHAQFVTYFAVSLVLFLLLRHQPPGPGQRKRNHTPMTMLERVFWSVVGLVGAFTVAWSRVYLNYHTERQVLVGCTAGMVIAVSWFGVTSVLRQTGWILWAMEIPLARWFRVRDLVIEEDLCQAGWEKWDDRMAAVRAADKKRS
ncbi:putative pap2 domain protein [Rosellinia necatrix]|uniref:Dolichyldiphosphatase n=1 Tax=Rosellinia necatrix TaxID=77044 RepID=A0A1S7ULV0_ROSNE|nr:putative pap2 domain protein [Rosellinia necatrix]